MYFWRYRVGLLNASRPSSGQNRRQMKRPVLEERTGRVGQGDRVLGEPHVRLRDQFVLGIIIGRGAGCLRLSASPVIAGWFDSSAIRIFSSALF